MTLRMALALLFVVLSSDKPRTQTGFTYDVIIDAANIKAMNKTTAKEQLQNFPQPKDFIVHSDYGVAIDFNDHIYVADDRNSRVCKFNSSGEWIGTISIPKEKYFDQYLIYPRFQLGIDNKNNLYVNACVDESEVVLYKFDSAGNLLKKFPLGDRKTNTSDRVIDFMVSRNGTIYINTFPAETFRPNWKNMVFAYDNTGHFLGMTDYFLEDSDGNIYKFDKSKKGVAFFVKFKKSFKESVKPSKQLRELAQIMLPETKETWLKKEYGNLWTFAGFDSMDNIFLTNGEVTKKLDKNLKEIEQIQTPLQSLREKNMRCSQRNLRVSPNGSLFIHGFKTSEQGKPKEDSFLLLKMASGKKIRR